MKDKLVGPFTIEMKIHFGGQNRIGAVAVGLGAGRFPTEQDVLRAVGKAVRSLPDGYTLLEGDEFFNQVLVKEATGRVGKFAAPAASRYDVGSLILQALKAYPKPEPKAPVLDDGDGDDDEEDFDDEDDA